MWHRADAYLPTGAVRAFRYLYHSGFWPLSAVVGQILDRDSPLPLSILARAVLDGGGDRAETHPDLRLEVGMRISR